MAMAADRRVWPTLEYTVGQWRRLRNAYYRLCEFADREIGRILAGLEAAGLAGDTVILFTSDHGDGHGAHRWNQKWVFYEESARVPFIVIDPQAPAARRGQVDHHLINNGIDLLPTVLDYAGAPVSDALPGHSVRPLVSGEPIVDWPDQTIGETTFGMLPRKSPGRMVRTARYKYCVYSWGQDREQLFDLALDPGEMVDLTVEARYRDVLANHRERLRRWCQETHDPFSAADSRLRCCNAIAARHYPMRPHLLPSSTRPTRHSFHRSCRWLPITEFRSIPLAVAEIGDGVTPAHLQRRSRYFIHEKTGWHHYTPVPK
jgi:arylsulfatase A-like enzyme